MQFQPDDGLYQRLFAEIALSLKHHPETEDWRATVLLARRSFEPPESLAYAPFLNLPNVSRIYLDEPPEFEREPFAWGLMRLIVGSPSQAPDRAKQLVRAATNNPAEEATLIELVETAMVYKFPKLRLEEIAKMLGMATEASQTRVFQEGRTQEGRFFVLRLIDRKLGNISPELVASIESLPLEDLESLGEALLDFNSIKDLQDWLQANS